MRAVHGMLGFAALNPTYKSYGKNPGPPRAQRIRLRRSASAAPLGGPRYAR